MKRDEKMGIKDLIQRVYRAPKGRDAKFPLSALDIIIELFYDNNDGRNWQLGT